jgi:hypothetical protein
MRMTSLKPAGSDVAGPSPTSASLFSQNGGASFQIVFKSHQVDPLVQNRLYREPLPIVPCHLLAFIHDNNIILCREIKFGEVKGMVSGEPSEDVSLPEKERKAYLRKNAMRCLLGILILHEDLQGKAMTHDEIVGTFKYPNIDTEVLLQEMLDRSYISRWVVQGGKDDSGQVTSVMICDAWGTTFFGRDWFRNDDHDPNEKHVHFYFVERPI